MSLSTKCLHPTKGTGDLGNVHKGCPIFLWFLETYVLYIIYYQSILYVRFPLTYLPTQKSDILYGRSLTTSYFFNFWWKIASYKYLVLWMLNSPLTSVLKFLMLLQDKLFYFIRKKSDVFSSLILSQKRSCDWRFFILLTTQWNKNKKTTQISQLTFCDKICDKKHNLFFSCAKRTHIWCSKNILCSNENNGMQQLT